MKALNRTILVGLAGRGELKKYLKNGIDSVWAMKDRGGIEDNYLGDYPNLGDKPATIHYLKGRKSVSNWLKKKWDY